MARRGDSVDTANSQFFIMFADGASLDGQYTVIGEVVQGMDVVDKLKKAPPGSAGGPVPHPPKMVKAQDAPPTKIPTTARRRTHLFWLGPAPLALCAAPPR